MHIHLSYRISTSALGGYLAAEPLRNQTMIKIMPGWFKQGQSSLGLVQNGDRDTWRTRAVMRREYY